MLPKRIRQYLKGKKLELLTKWEVKTIGYLFFRYVLLTEGLACSGRIFLQGCVVLHCSYDKKKMKYDAPEANIIILNIIANNIKLRRKGHPPP